MAVLSDSSDLHGVMCSSRSARDCCRWIAVVIITSATSIPILVLPSSRPRVWLAVDTLKEVVMVDNVVLLRFQEAPKMLREAIGACLDCSDRNRSWAAGHHGVFHAELYSSPSQEVSTSRGVRVNRHPALSIDPLGDPTKLRPKNVYSKAGILATCDPLGELVAPRSGLWIRYPLRLSRVDALAREEHLGNICHIRHRAGRRIERLRQGTGRGGGWVPGVR